MATVRARHETLTSYVVSRADDAGFTLASPRDASARGGMVRLLVDDSKAVWRALLDRNIVVDERAGGIRVAPHFFTTTDEIDTLFGALAELGARSP